jgi:hypothetical protein
MMTLGNMRQQGVRSLSMTAIKKHMTAIAVMLWAVSATAKPVDLICMVPQATFYFTVTFDEEKGSVLFEGLPTIKAVIEQNRIVFTMMGRDDSYGYVIDRLTGAMIVLNQRTGTSQNSSCKMAKKAF